jgi:hypothetical protein
VPRLSNVNKILPKGEPEKVKKLQFIKMKGEINSGVIFVSLF